MEDVAGGSIPYCGPAPAPAAAWTAWNLDPPLLLALGLLVVAGTVLSRRPLVFVAGWLALVLAFVSPLCALTTALFSVRALHHLLLVGVAAPLFAVALPKARPGPGAFFCLTAAALVLWHVPAVYAAAWNGTTIYWLMQGLLLVPAWGFWSGVLQGGRSGDAGTMVVSAVLIGGLAGVMGLIGAVLVFAGDVLYPQHRPGALAWGTDPLADQQLAGLVMWVPGLLPLAAIAGLVAARAWRREAFS
ncbi:cytochrome c oxidase assembly protein [Niveispirillum fermenti]|uniref:cytochrome c oxidase assembly protein n=1 Tax=Niveispirillum fermenti TaxID=1233113 RepID=UPI003A83CE4B